MALISDFSIQDENIELLLQDMLEVYGYDFTNYSKASLKRRINRLFSMDKFPSFAEFRFRIKTDPQYMERFMEEITVNVTEMFRDTHFYKALREEILPKLGTYPLIRIWHAGCSTGEEVYSMAILLKELNLLHKSLLYATDINTKVLENARSGMFSLNNMKQYSENYINAGGKRDFSEYYTAHYNYVKFADKLKERMIFSTHNLVSDRSFNEFQLILCRNVLIYFDSDLQNRVYSLLDTSLQKLGYLALGSKENLKFSQVSQKYQQLQDNLKIFHKIA